MLRLLLMNSPLISFHSIHVVLISSKIYDGYMIDVDIFFNIEDIFQASRSSSHFVSREKPFLFLSTGDENILGPPSMNKSPGSMGVFDRNTPVSHSPGANYRTSFDFAEVLLDDYKFAQSPRYRIDINSFNQEEAALHAELFNAFQARNTRVTVAVLRKIYTKQTRGFRIPDLLREIFPLLGENGILTNPNASAYILFTLSCVQWCLGMPNGEKPDSYKYKMNKNIARWLLKELQRKGLPSILPNDVAHAAYSVIAHILENNMEPDFAQELALILGVPNISKLNITPKPLESPGQAYETKFTFDIATGTISATQTPVNSQQIRETFEQLRDLLSSDMSIQQIHTAIPRMNVDHRLFLLVAKSPGGILGARIPSLYREVFGDRLRLQGKKLKDILLGKYIIGLMSITETLVASGMVEMVGSDGPGDKLFRLISDQHNAPSSNDPPLDTPTDPFTAHSFNAVPANDTYADGSSLFARFRTFPRDEGSQLDKVLRENLF